MPYLWDRCPEAIVISRVALAHTHVPISAVERTIHRWFRLDYKFSLEQNYTSYPYYPCVARVYFLSC